MNHLVKRCCAVIVLATFALSWVAALAHAEATPEPSGIAIAQPLNGDTMVNLSPQISGTAPPQTLVLVSVVDTDTGRGGVKHQPNGRIDGSVTSDADGNWVFVPQVDMVPGGFEAVASYVTADNKTVQSAPMRFVVVNESGASAEPTAGFKWMVALILLGALLIIGFVVYRIIRRRRHPAPSGERRHLWPRRASRDAGPPPPAPVTHAEVARSTRDRAYVDDDERDLEPIPHRGSTRGARSVGLVADVPQGWEELAPAPVGAPLFINTAAGRAYQEQQARKLRAMEEEMQSIERALAETAESLERSNSTITSLRRALHDDLRDDMALPDIGARSDRDRDRRRDGDRDGDREPDRSPPDAVSLVRSRQSLNGHYVP